MCDTAGYAVECPECEYETRVFRLYGEMPECPECDRYTDEIYEMGSREPVDEKVVEAAPRLELKAGEKARALRGNDGE